MHENRCHEKNYTLVQILNLIIVVESVLLHEKFQMYNIDMKIR